MMKNEECGWLLATKLAALLVGLALSLSSDAGAQDLLQGHSSGCTSLEERSAEFSIEFYRQIVEVRVQNCLRTNDVNYQFFAEKIACDDGRSLGMDTLPAFETGCPDPHPPCEGGGGGCSPHDHSDDAMPRNKVEFLSRGILQSNYGNSIGSCFAPPVTLDCSAPSAACAEEYQQCLQWSDRSQYQPEFLFDGFLNFVCQESGFPTFQEPRVGSGEVAYWWDPFWNAYQVRDSRSNSVIAVSTLEEAQEHCRKNWRQGRWFGANELRFVWRPASGLKEFLGRYRYPFPVYQRSYSLRSGYGLDHVQQEFRGVDRFVICNLHEASCEDHHVANCGSSFF